jgi:hypothetical protein
MAQSRRECVVVAISQSLPAGQPMRVVACMNQTFRSAVLTLCSMAAPFLAACGSNSSLANLASDAGTRPGADATMFDTGEKDTSGGDSPDEESSDADASHAVTDSETDVAIDAGAPDVGGADTSAADAVVDSGADVAITTGVPDVGIADTGTGEAATDSDASGTDSPIQSEVLTQHDDNARTGANLHESALTVANVGPATFGKLFTRAVDDQTYAQPLVMQQVAIPGQGVHNVLYVATMSDTVYAFDADDPNQSAPLWKTSFVDTANGIVPVTHGDVAGCGILSNISGNIGIESTPVIDPAGGTMFVVGKTKNQSGAQTYTLHALDVGTGLDQVSPVVIQASTPGNGAGSIGSTIQFDASIENQRASLLLANGKVYIAFGAYCGSVSYHGWLLAYDAVTLAQDAMMITTSNGLGGGMWMSGEGPSADVNGSVYVTVSGGSMDVTTAGADFSEALLELTPSLTVADWFAPFDYASLNSGGNFYGSTGVLLLPDSTLSVTGSEMSMLYVNDTTNLGHWNMSGDTQIVQSFQLGGSAIHGSPVAMGNMVYVWAAGDTLRSYRLTGGQLVPAQVGPTALSSGQPGGELSLSANGTTPGTGILWVAQPLNDASQATVPGILQAYDATNLTSELWDSLLVAGDDCGSFAKFASPTVANGKVYLPSFANQVCVYGTK